LVGREQAGIFIYSSGPINCDKFLVISVLFS
jgi:hypothetical protein